MTVDGESIPSQVWDIDETEADINMTMTVDLAGCSDIGAAREYQEDAFDLPFQPLQSKDYKRGLLFIVADGVGGLRAGDVASRTAVTTVRRVFYENWSPDIRYILERAVSSANAAVYVSGLEADSGGMGSTIVCCVLRGDQLITAHVGDSRLYRLRNGLLEQLTNDHSWVREQMALGVLTEEEARHHPRRHQISRALGSQPTVEVELLQFNLADDDRLMLCSDGLYDLVSDEDMVHAMVLPPREGCKRLIKLANAAGGLDNITVVLAHVSLDEKATYHHNDKTEGRITEAMEKTAEHP
jgi:PPM family protein phosphatase